MVTKFCELSGTPEYGKIAQLYMHYQIIDELLLINSSNINYLQWQFGAQLTAQILLITAMQYFRGYSSYRSECY